MIKIDLIFECEIERTIQYVLFNKKLGFGENIHR